MIRLLVQITPVLKQSIQPRGDVLSLERMGVFVCILGLHSCEAWNAQIREILTILAGGLCFCTRHCAYPESTHKLYILFPGIEYNSFPFAQLSIPELPSFLYSISSRGEMGHKWGYLGTGISLLPPGYCFFHPVSSIVDYLVGRANRSSIIGFSQSLNCMISHFKATSSSIDA